MSALRWGAATSEGLVRDANEDAYVAMPLVFAVADGMGGHQAGEVASALAVQTVRDRLGQGAATVEPVIAAVVDANAAIFSAARRNSGQQGMGTTLTALAVLGPTPDDPTRTLALVNVGDSRTYRVRGGKLERVTIDHSYVQELVATGHISEVEARTHPRRNIVTRALGIEPTVRVDSWVLSMVRGDRFVLCSDGLVDEVPDSEIEVVAAGVEDPQAAADELVAMANRHGGRDNVTVIVVDVAEGMELTDEPQLLPERDVVGDGEDTVTLPVTAAPVEPPSAGDGSSAAAPADPDGTSATEAVRTAPQLPPRDGQGVGTAPLVTPPADLAGTSALPRRERKRRFTLGLFLFLLALAAVITVTIVLIAVAASDDEPDAPETTVPSSLDTAPDTTSESTAAPTLPTTTLPPTTLPPTTAASATTTASPTTAAATTSSP